MSQVAKCVKDCLTEQDGESYCPFRVGVCLSLFLFIPCFLALETWSVIVLKQPFEMGNFGAAFGEMMTGLSIVGGVVTAKGKFIETTTDGEQ